MRVLIGAAISFFAVGVVAAQALTVDDIIKLKRAGVADSTVELLIKRDGDSRSAGVWRQDGWIIHSTPSSEASYEYEPRYYVYPTVVIPRPFLRRHFR